MRHAMQGPAAAWAAAGDHEAVAPRHLILGISERPLGVDELLGRIFWQMRSALGLPVEHVAAYLQTTPELILLLEAGDLRGLPSWQETWRVVTAYAHWLRVDPAPILERMHHQIASTRVDIGSFERQSSRASPPPRHETVAAPAGHVAPPKKQERRRGLRRRGSLVLAVTSPLVLGMLATYAAHVRPAPLMTAIGALPAPIEQPVRAALDLVLRHTSERRGGFVWIDVADPRSRKSDRLPTAHR